MQAKPHIIIVGANFAGLAAASEIGSFAEVTVIDPAPYFEFIPNIHELISGEKEPTDLRLDKRKLIEKMGHSWVQDRVVDLQLDENRVILSSGEALSYDACILAIGGVDDFRGVTGAEQFAYTFKSVDDCHKIGERITQLREAQEKTEIVIVGGGSEGVEALGELLRFRNKSPELDIHLIEPQEQLLPALSNKASKEILQLCKELPVQFHFGLRVDEVQADQVLLSDGQTLSSDLTIWTGGVKANPLLQEAGLIGKGRWASVNSSLQSRHHQNLFIAGDAADIRGLDSKQAYFAIESGQVAGKNAAKFVRKRHHLQRFYPISRPYLYSFGDLSCFMMYGPLVLAGSPLAVLKEGIYQKSMLDMQSEDPFMKVVEIYNQLSPSVAKELGKGLEAFFDSPIDFILRPSVRLL